MSWVPLVKVLLILATSEVQARHYQSDLNSWVNYDCSTIQEFCACKIWVPLTHLKVSGSSRPLLGWTLASANVGEKKKDFLMKYLGTLSLTSVLLHLSRGSQSRGISALSANLDCTFLCEQIHFLCMVSPWGHWFCCDINYFSGQRQFFFTWNWVCWHHKTVNPDIQLSMRQL